MERRIWRGEVEVEAGKGYNQWGVIRRGCSGEIESEWKRWSEEEAREAKIKEKNGIMSRREGRFIHKDRELMM